MAVPSGLMARNLAKIAHISQIRQILGRCGADLGHIWGDMWAAGKSIWGRCGADLGHIWADNLG